MRRPRAGRWGDVDDRGGRAVTVGGVVADGRAAEPGEFYDQSRPHPLQATIGFGLAALTHTGGRHPLEQLCRFGRLLDLPAALLGGPARH
ncbi:hypothetical protein [Nocardia gipuzkoensis]|uniref:hypothetical protein n=1 Tax=Nocardia gipuzkoensis TaxID=2749991 RepID=UPI00237D58E7|nr:hypothetical protein [Nocardia gipuzkoensis]MDE1675454.1 hypothetical protein [Nocardia gipuzkoensis]